MTKPNIFSFVAYILILFFGTTILVNMNSNANESYRQEWELRAGKSMQYVFLANDGEQYDLYPVGVNKKGEHGSALNYNFLLPTDVDDELYSEEDGYEEDGYEHGSAEQQEISGSDDEIIGFKEPKNAYDALWDTLEDRTVFINTIFEYLLRGDIVELPEGAARYVVILNKMDKTVQKKAFEEQSCLTPWGYTIEHGQSVFAYQQRSDAQNVCNIQRRTCLNGKLTGSFTQASCDESAVGNYKKIAHKSYNASITSDYKNDEFIQPPKEAKNANAEFDMNGKLKTPEEPKFIAGPSGDELLDESYEVPQESVKRSSCVTPWGEKIQAGQFTKAYKFKNGFYDIPCKVQIRLCVDGELEGTYQYASCDVWNTSYEDFLDGYMNSEQPSPRRLLKLLQADFEPDPEYGNNLSSEMLDKVIKILSED